MEASAPVVMFDRSAEVAGHAQRSERATALLVSQLRRLMTASPFYRRKLAAAGIQVEDIRDITDLTGVPFTTKDELRVSQEAVPPFGDYLVTSPNEVKRLYQTSGTTGAPCLVALTSNDMAMMTDIGARSYTAMGLGEKNTILVTTGAGPYIAGHMFSVLERLGCGVVPVGPGNTERVVSALRHRLVDTLSCTVSFALYLIDRLPAEGLDPADLGVVNLFVGGEPGGGVPAIRDQMSRAFGIEPSENMGISDISFGLFSECLYRQGMHFHGNGVIWPELVDERGVSIPIEAGAVGELVYTALTREAMPLVRFRSRDIVDVLGTACECGRTGFRMRVKGRADDLFIVRGVNVYPSAVQSVVAEFRPEVTGRSRIVLPRGAVSATPPVPIEVEVPDGHDGDTTLVDRLQTELRARLTFRTAVTLVGSTAFGGSDYKTKAIVRV
jgi:phenylacetate-CoA ligase